MKAKKGKAKNSHKPLAARKRAAEKLVGDLTKAGELNPDHRKSFDDLVDRVLGIPRKK